MTSCNIVQEANTDTVGKEKVMFIRRITISLIITLLSVTNVYTIDLLEAQSQLAKIAEDVTPTIVNISTIKFIKQRQSGYTHDPLFNNAMREFFGDDFFHYFSPQTPHNNQKQQSLGSGVIVSKQGHILTNHHVIDGADEIKVTLSDEREFDARVIGTDPKTDVGVIKIEGVNLPFAKLGDSSALKVGYWAIAIGSPFGLNRSITFGIISATGRSNIGIVDYENFIQTDAAINPGNSGGALVNMLGEVVGINTAIFSRSGGYQGIGFAIPISMAKNVMNALIAEGKVSRGWLGVIIQPITSDLQKQFNLKTKSGVLIGDVAPDGPADKAGIRRGDVIVQFDDNPVADVFTLRNRVAATALGKTVRVHVERKGRSRVFKVKITASPDNEDGLSKSRKDITNKVGMTVEELEQTLARRFGYAGDRGVVVTDIFPGGPANASGLVVGDLIKEANRKEIRTLSDYTSAISRAKSDSNILFLVRRGQYTQYVVVSVE